MKQIFRHFLANDDENREGVLGLCVGTLVNVAALQTRHNGCRLLFFSAFLSVSHCDDIGINDDIESRNDNTIPMLKRTENDTKKKRKK